ncbi:MAG: hypothetical protein JWO22_833 [Frankiales bacterium]|nr:hypothetical protein [Frankiales bacterium]
MADTKGELLWKSHLAFVLAGLSTLGAVYLSFTTLPPTKLAHGRLWIVSIALVIALLCCAIGVLDRHLIAKAPRARALPSVGQAQAGILLTGVQALAMLVVGVVQLGQGEVSVGSAALVAVVGFIIVMLCILRQPTRADEAEPQARGEHGAGSCKA